MAASFLKPIIDRRNAAKARADKRKKEEAVLVEETEFEEEPPEKKAAELPALKQRENAAIQAPSSPSPKQRENAAVQTAESDTDDDDDFVPNKKGRADKRQRVEESEDSDSEETAGEEIDCDERISDDESVHTSDREFINDGAVEVEEESEDTEEESDGRASPVTVEILWRVLGAQHETNKVRATSVPQALSIMKHLRTRKEAQVIMLTCGESQIKAMMPWSTAKAILKEF